MTAGTWWTCCRPCRARPSESGPPELADGKDPRVTALVTFLDSHPWRGLSLQTLCRLLVEILHESA